MTTSDLAQESDKILRNYLHRLQDVLGNERKSLLDGALNSVGLKWKHLKEQPLQQQQFGEIISYLRRNGIPEITLKLFNHLMLPDFGLYGYALASSDNLQKACEIASQYLRLTSDRFQEHFYIEGDRAILECLPNPLYRHQRIDICEEFIAGNWRGFHLLLPDSIDLSQIKICLDYPAPDYQHHYKALFSCKVNFGGDKVHFIFPAAWLASEITTADADLVALCQAQCESLLDPEKNTHELINKIRNLVMQERHFLMTLDQAAQRYCMSPRTLRQHLYDLGTSFKDIVLDLRMQIAKQYLESTYIPIKEIAYLLNYSQPSAFQRAFKAYFDISPKQMRKTSGLKASIARIR